ncbi:hypothetical protein BU26DRAFT_258575 [Trematosphaeria pertusa]|uniref:Uncharacterized protein n=1 Tax=Trematosphaeria pertusa TaxID=390896 RepID=A0A6A6IPS3_9PLEO|nr:uncharacterized protein BU26DRAFT_258575 [Trematosphaeria pertusa]KAF2252544.1 hypothetical protein BU26DRAFT_258575 [Trematosphaeria pertusa]
MLSNLGRNALKEAGSRSQLVRGLRIPKAGSRERTLYLEGLTLLCMCSVIRPGHEVILIVHADQWRRHKQHCRQRQSPTHHRANGLISTRQCRVYPRTRENPKAPSTMIIRALERTADSKIKRSSLASHSYLAIRLAFHPPGHCLDRRRH